MMDVDVVVETILEVVDGSEIELDSLGRLAVGSGGLVSGDEAVVVGGLAGGVLVGNAGDVVVSLIIVLELLDMMRSCLLNLGRGGCLKDRSMSAIARGLRRVARPSHCRI
jgi:hypothetical protein